MYDDREKEGRKVQLLYADRMAQLVRQLGLESIATCKAIHCPHAFCLSFTTKAGFKMAYSGDTRPNPAFRDLGKMGGRGPDLLIHEATMEHFMINDARIKKHSTMTEAIEEGEGMDAKFTLLTHFSQRWVLNAKAIIIIILPGMPRCHPLKKCWVKSKSELHLTT